ncbi:MAG: hypothetical protein LBM61_03560 [Prevotellaceae bacterium]|jgi:hypothetical protein|nr:hypothetical protein [Prevotellaceae bacterium]
MSEQELNSYRLTGMDEPTDEMLAAVWHEVVEEAKRKSEDAHRELFRRIHDTIAAQRLSRKQHELNQ